MSVPVFGVCFHREQPAADIARQARAVEQAGYDELWVIEDLFYTAGPSLAAAALTATDTLGVGIGVMPAAVRNPAATAMEIATLAAMAPGRFHAGVGHGVQDWMAQIGAREASPVTLLEETIVAVRRLLAGERFSSDGRYVTLDDVALVTPPHPTPRVSTGVRGPKSLQMSGRCADGTILAELCSPAYLRWAREQIEVGGGGASHRITVFCSIAVSADGDDARHRDHPLRRKRLRRRAARRTNAPLLPGTRGEGRGIELVGCHRCDAGGLVERSRTDRNP